MEGNIHPNKSDTKKFHLGSSQNAENNPIFTFFQGENMVIPVYISKYHQMCVYICWQNQTKTIALPPFNPTHLFHDDVIKWKYLLRYWPLVRGIHHFISSTISFSKILIIYCVQLQLCMTTDDIIDTSKVTRPLLLYMISLFVKMMVSHLIWHTKTQTYKKVSGAYDVNTPLESLYILRNQRKFYPN